MTNDYIFPKALKKAIKNGLDLSIYGPIVSACLGWWVEREHDYIKLSVVETLAPTVLISHEFAKAFWGTGIAMEDLSYSEWQYQLQQMVLEEDPIQYLEKFI